MKINIRQDELLAGVQVVQRAISSKSTLPILNGIYLSAQNGLLYLRATDLEIGIEYSVAVEVIEEGTTVLPAKYFAEIVRKLPNMEITLENKEDSNLFKITYGTSEVELNTYDHKEYPVLPKIEGLYNLQVNPELLVNAIKFVSIAASSDASRPIFTGILLEITERGFINLVATDTHRLAYRQVNFNNESAENLNLSLIIPSRALNELSRIIRPEEEILEIQIAEKLTLFKTQNVMLISRLIEGQFPEYQEVIPKEFTSQIRVLTKGFRDSLERAALLSKDDLKTRSNVIKLNAQGNTLTISSQSAEIGKIHEEIPIYLNGEEIEIAFNAKYLIDVLRVMDQEEIYLNLKGALSAGVIKPTDNNNYLFLVLPVRLA
ncbi:DNA polymerase III subunit beta [Bacillota bacterium LX-D]|nr:DNA polymerase III subunit beta [Bacillota bacterium LX-D]